MKKEAANRDPVCGMRVDPRKAVAWRMHLGRKLYFCSPACAEEFEANPHRYLETESRQASRQTAG